MNIYNIKNKNNEIKLYNKILLLSRNKLLYTNFKLNDTFQNRINLIFFHTSFLFIKIKDKKDDNIYKDFYQKMFDFVFKKIEENMREIGWGDVTVNKNMKHLVKTFYNILLNCEKFHKKSSSSKIIFLNKYLVPNNDIKQPNNEDLVAYFDKYQTFCVDLSIDSVLKGDLNFEYK